MTRVGLAPTYRGMALALPLSYLVINAVVAVVYVDRSGLDYLGCGVRIPPLEDISTSAGLTFALDLVIPGFDIFERTQSHISSKGYTF